MILRVTDSLLILAFEHPLAGFQLVKGTIESGETPADAAVRELFEESGLVATQVLADLGVWRSGHQDQDWSFHLCAIPDDSPEMWVHAAADDGGHDFRFFWHPLHVPPGEGWHPVFRDALTYLSVQAPALLSMIRPLTC